MTRSQRLSFLGLFLICIIGFVMLLMAIKEIEKRQVETAERVISIDNYCKE